MPLFDEDYEEGKVGVSRLNAGIGKIVDIFYQKRENEEMGRDASLKWAPKKMDRSTTPPK